MISISTQKHSARPTRRAASRSIAVLSALALVAALAGCSQASEPQATIPADFPSAVDVPLGTITASGARDGAWTVSVKLDKDDTRQSAIERLTGQGFTIIGESGSHANDRVYSLASDTYSVRVGVTTIDGTDVLNYTVAKQQDVSK